MEKRTWGGAPGEANTAGARRIATAAALQLGGRGVNIAFGVAAVALLARALGPDGFGVWSAALSLVGIFGVLADLGLVQVATQRMSAEPEREQQWLGALVGTVAVASVIAVLVTIAAAPLLGSEGQADRVAAILALGLLTAGPGAMLAVFDARVRAGLRMGILTFNSLLWLATIIVLDQIGASIEALAVAFVATQVLVGMLGWVVTRRFAQVAVRRGRQLWRPLLRVALPLGLAGVLVTVYYRVDSVLLFTIAGAEEAGVYGAAYRFLDPLHFLPSSVMLATFPVISALHGRDPERLRRLLQRSGEYLVIAALGVLAVVSASADELVEVLLGPGYEQTAGLLPILMLAFVFISIGYLAGYLVPVVGLQWRLVAFAAVGLIVNVALNLVLIPRFGASGAAWATVATEGVVNLVAVYAVFKALEFRPAAGPIVRTVFAAALVYGVTSAVVVQVGLIPALVAAGPAYLAALFALRVVVPAELREVLATSAGNDLDPS